MRKNTLLWQAGTGGLLGASARLELWAVYGPVQQAGDGAGEQSLEGTLGRQADRAWCETRSPSPNLFQEKRFVCWWEQTLAFWSPVHLPSMGNHFVKERGCLITLWRFRLSAYLTFPSH